MQPSPYQSKNQHLPPGLAGRGRRGTGAPMGVSAGEVENFVYHGSVMPVSSSNVFAVQFLIDDAAMIVQYQDENGSPGQHYQYDPVDVYEAVDFANAGSKGKFVWDHLRVRGSKTAHKKNVKKVAGFRAVKV